MPIPEEMNYQPESEQRINSEERKDSSEKEQEISPDILEKASNEASIEIASANTTANETVASNSDFIEQKTRDLEPTSGEALRLEADQAAQEFIAETKKLSDLAAKELSNVTDSKEDGVDNVPAQESIQSSEGIDQGIDSPKKESRIRFDRSSDELERKRVARNKRTEEREKNMTDEERAEKEHESQMNEREERELAEKGDMTEQELAETIASGAAYMELLDLYVSPTETDKEAGVQDILERLPQQSRESQGDYLKRVDEYLDANAKKMSAIPAEERFATLIDSEFYFDTENPKDKGKKASEELSGTIIESRKGLYIIDLDKESSDNMREKVKGTYMEDIHGGLVYPEDGKQNSEIPTYIIRLQAAEKEEVENFDEFKEGLTRHEFHHLAFRANELSGGTVPYEQDPRLDPSVTNVDQDVVEKGFIKFRDELAAYNLDQKDRSLAKVKAADHLMYQTTDRRVLKVGEKTKGACIAAVKSLQEAGIDRSAVLPLIMNSKNFSDMRKNLLRLSSTVRNKRT